MIESGTYKLFDDDEEIQKENEDDIFQLIDEDNIIHKFSYLYHLGLSNKIFIIAKKYPDDNKDNYFVFEIVSNNLVAVRNDNILFMVESYLTLINKINSGTPIIIESNDSLKFQYNIFDKILLNKKKYYIASKIYQISKEKEEYKSLDENIVNDFENNEFAKKTALSKNDDVENLKDIITSIPQISNIIENNINSDFKQKFLGIDIPIPSDTELYFIILEKNNSDNFIITTEKNALEKIAEKYSKNLEITEKNLSHLIDLTIGKFKEEFIAIKDKNNNIVEAKLLSKIFIDKKEYYFISLSDESEKAIACYMNENKEFVLVNSPSETRKIESFLNKKSIHI